MSATKVQCRVDPDAHQVRVSREAPSRPNRATPSKDSPGGGHSQSKTERRKWPAGPLVACDQLESISAGQPAGRARITQSSRLAAEFAVTQSIGARGQTGKKKDVTAAAPKQTAAMSSTLFRWLFAIGLTAVCGWALVGAQTTAAMAQEDPLDDASLENVTATTALPIGFLVQAAMQVPTYADIATAEFVDKLEQRLRTAVVAAFDRQRAKHLSGSDASVRLLMGDDYGNNTPSGSAAHAIGVEITTVVRNPPRGRRVLVSFLVRFMDEPVNAQVVVNDLALLSLGELSAIIGYPVDQVAVHSSEEQESGRLWIIGVVIGATICLLLCGWCLLFAYYNTCGRPLNYRNANDGRRKQLWRTSSSGGIVLQPEAGEAYQSDNGQQSHGTKKIYLKEEPVQTDLTGGGVSQRMNELGLSAYYEIAPPPMTTPYYAAVSKPAPSPAAPQATSDAPRENEYLRPRLRSADARTLPSAPASGGGNEGVVRDHTRQHRERAKTPEEKRATSHKSGTIVPGNDAVRSQSRMSASSIAIDGGPVPTDPVHAAPISQPINWTPHFAGDEMQRIFHIYQSGYGSASENPRPMPSVSDSGALEFHTRELVGDRRQVSNDQLIRDTYMRSLEHIV
uniref:Uncharacterized protein n=1 Tax=Plectus sambesii TaxID=2011161 RepID=A0A914V1N3_9BILA